MSLNFDYEQNETFSTEDFLKDEREAAKRAKQEKRNRKRYKFSDKGSSKWGIASIILGVLGAALLILSIILSAIAKGAGGEIIGQLCLGSFILSFVGIVMGLLAFRETDVFLNTAWAGIIISGIIWILDGFMVIAGL